LQAGGESSTGHGKRTERLSTDSRRLVRIPRHLLHVELDDLERLGVTAAHRAQLRALLADLPQVPEAQHSAQIVGPAEVALPMLAVVARHVGQGLRDANIALRVADRERLRAERRKLAFVSECALVDLGSDEARYAGEAALFVVGGTHSTVPLLLSREAQGLVSFVTTESPLEELAHWRRVAPVV
jgi:hypothetical protein